MAAFWKEGDLFLLKLVRNFDPWWKSLRHFVAKRILIQLLFCLFFWGEGEDEGGIDLRNGNK
jgi:hypothetical protein